MFNFIVHHRESNLHLLRWLLVALLVELAATVELLLLTWPASVLFLVTKKLHLPLVVSRCILLPFGRFVALRRPRPRRCDSARICKSSSPAVVFAHRLWNWPEMVRRLCSLLFNSNRSPSSSSSASTPLYCYRAEGIVFARAERYQRPVLLCSDDDDGDDDACGQIVHQNAFPDCSVQAADNPCSVNSPVFVTFVLRTLYCKLLGRNWIGSESECLQLCIYFSAECVEAGEEEYSTATRTRVEEHAAYATTARKIYAFVHGGAFTMGSYLQSSHDSRSWWDQEAHQQRRENVDEKSSSASAASWRSGNKNEIVVHIQYRLGVLGFLQGIDGIESNLGMRDVLCALQWINRMLLESARRVDDGYDDGNAGVCLIGQSAGALIVSALSQCPAARGLFRTVFLMSGASLHVHGPKERDACRAILEKVTHTVLASSSAFPAKQRLLHASRSQLMQIQSLYCSAVDSLYRTFKLETRYIPVNLCVDQDSLIPIHPHHLLRQHPQHCDDRTATGSHCCPPSFFPSRLLLSTTAAEYCMFCMKHQDAAVMADPERQKSQTQKRIRQFVSAALAETSLEIGGDVPASPLAEVSASSLLCSSSSSFPTNNKNNKNNTNNINTIIMNVLPSLDDQAERKRQFIRAKTMHLLETYCSLWRSGYLDSRYLISRPRRGVAAFPGKLWCTLMQCWTFRIPNEIFACDVLIQHAQYREQQKQRERERCMMMMRSSTTTSTMTNNKIHNHDEDQKRRASEKRKMMVRVLRTETPIDLMPSMSSPHTGDVSFLFGALHAFPHLLLESCFTCPRRFDLALRLRGVLRLMHCGSDEDIQREMPAPRNDDDDDTMAHPPVRPPSSSPSARDDAKSSFTVPCSSSCSSSSPPPAPSSSSSFWRLPKPVEVHVLRMTPPLDMQQLASRVKRESVLSVDREEPEREQERHVINSAWEDVMRALLILRR